MENKIIPCIQCDTLFVVTISEQRQFASKGFGEPKFCPACRKKKSKESCHKITTRRNDKKKHFRLKYED